MGRRAKINTTDGEESNGFVPGPMDFPVFDNGADHRKGLKHWFGYYNQERFHQSLGGLTPDEVYFKERKWLKAA